MGFGCAVKYALVPAENICSLLSNIWPTMDTVDLIHTENFQSQLREIVRSVGRFIRAEAGTVRTDQIEIKGLNSLVSYVDQEAERRLVAGLQQILPGSAFLTEEETVATGSGEWRWIIDPLDGTTNFLHQLPCYAVSVALQQGEELRWGAVYEPNNDEYFHALHHGGAYLNGRPLRLSDTTSLADGLLATGFPYYDFSRMEGYLHILRELMEQCRGIRRWGSAAVDLAYVAAGRFDGFFEYSLHPWDVAAGTLLVREAGGQVTNFRGTDQVLFGREIIAASANVHRELLQRVSKYLGD